MTKCSNQERFIDSGANDHMLSNFNCLKYPKSCASNSLSVKLPNGETAPVSYIGPVPLTNKL